MTLRAAAPAVRCPPLCPLWTDVCSPSCPPYPEGPIKAYSSCWHQCQSERKEECEVMKKCVVTWDERDITTSCTFSLFNTCLTLKGLGVKTGFCTNPTWQSTTDLTFPLWTLTFGELNVDLATWWPTPLVWRYVDKLKDKFDLVYRMVNNNALKR